MYRRIRCEVIVVGSGAAAYSAADSIYDAGVTDVAIVSEGRESGTSRNTGSDKQTYYKLTISGEEPDSVRAMAETLFSGQLVDGDHALSEAALSTRAFYRLVNYGVPFPHTDYGEYVGYKTDHDPRERATSVGPYTSREMTIGLEAACFRKGIAFHDRLLVVKILTDDLGAGKGNADASGADGVSADGISADGVSADDGASENNTPHPKRFKGLVCLDLDNLEDPEQRFVIIEAAACVWATGGPAALYRDSVFPGSQHGASGIAFEAGALGKNLTEWQFGLASVKPRWNVSGTYMQVLPRFISVDEDGDENEFLFDHFDLYHALDLVFLKGYQWPFDVTRSSAGSSQIDLLVHEETKKGRKVYLDFRRNPKGLDELDFTRLSDEAREYLEASDACFGSPIERLRHMNEPAIDFYLDHNVDLNGERLEIALCAQHNNGGLDVDENWMTAVDGLYAVGEVAGTHGIYRPGGSALNAGQVGGIKAAQGIAARKLKPSEIHDDAIRDLVDDTKRALSGGESFFMKQRDITRRMSAHAGAIRDLEGMQDLLQDTKAALDHSYGVDVAAQLPSYFRFLDLLKAVKVYLKAFCDYAETGGTSRGSALYQGTHKPLTVDPHDIQLVSFDGEITRRPVRPIPPPSENFETVWRLDRRRKAEHAKLRSEERTKEN